MLTNARDRRTKDLPTALTTFIGRGREFQEVSDLLHRDDVRLVTLTGSGGIGKTRLALEVGKWLRDDTLDSVAFVDLSPVSDVDAVLSTMGHVLGVAETDNQSIFDHLVAALQE
ncbi:MAG: NB-ARC domain-containing protein, partial [Thermomicrobiales bacterium]